ncbi:MAG: G-D-S-L family lipolytic protein [Terrimonas sp.]|nr:G-D-S-L family lipolytic protein [Terrimonas sp.]
MKKILPLVFLLALFAYIPQKKKKVIFFGDSITQAGVKPGGYITLIDSMCKLEGLSDGYEFIGAGIGGNKVYDLYLRMQEDVLDKHPDIVVIFVGVNDIWHKRTYGTGTDPDKFEKFYQAIINKITENGGRVILCTPACIGEKTDFSNEQDGDLNEYSKIIRQIAAKNKVPLVDLRQIFLAYDQKNNPDNKDRGILTVDRVHLNSTGNQLVADKMWNQIKQY